MGKNFDDKFEEDKKQPEESRSGKVKEVLKKNKSAALGLAVMFVVSSSLSACSLFPTQEKEEEEDDTYYSSGGHSGGSYFYNRGGGYNASSWGKSSSSNSTIKSGSSGYSSSKSGRIGG